MKQDDLRDSLVRIDVLLQRNDGVCLHYKTELYDEVEAVKYAMDRAFKEYPKEKFALLGFDKSDGNATVRTEKMVNGTFFITIPYEQAT